MYDLLQRCTVAACTALLGCSPTPSSLPDAGADAAPAVDLPLGPLVEPSLWSELAASDDPFDDRPDSVDCARGFGWDIELLDVDETIGIDTSACNYLGLQQPALRAVEPGETLAVQIWHFQLEGGGPGHAAVAVDGEIVWEKTIPIPAEAALIYEEFAVPAGAAAGAPIVFHLHNHGLNTWNLVAIREPD